MTIYELIVHAKRHLDDDSHLANYILRDTKEVREAGLTDLAWSLHRSSPHKNDVLSLITSLENYLAEGKDG